MRTIQITQNQKSGKKKSPEKWNQKHFLKKHGQAKILNTRHAFIIIASDFASEQLKSKTKIYYFAYRFNIFSWKWELFSIELISGSGRLQKILKGSAIYKGSRSFAQS